MKMELCGVTVKVRRLPSRRPNHTGVPNPLVSLAWHCSEPDIVAPLVGSTRSRVMSSISALGSAPLEEHAMDILYSSVAGLDVHLRMLVACVRTVAASGKITEEVRTYGTMTRDILELLDWLRSRNVTHVAMEATGVLWKPIWNILDGQFELLLVNPRHLKQVPGRKSDVRDCQWIAQLLQCGLLRSSFVPPRAQRELRDLTRQRTQLTAEQTRIANRIHKTLEDANIKLGAVASDILGKSSRAMLEALLAGERDVQTLAEMAQGRLRAKIPQLKLALRGHFTGHHAFMIRQLLKHLDYLDQQIAEFSARIVDYMREQITPEQMERLDAVTGLNQRTIEKLVAEIGTDMSRFPDARHLSSWAGVCPGNEESAGKRKRSKTTKGNVWLRRGLAEAAWAAARSKGTYLGAQYRRLAARRGKKRALMAVAHSLLVIFYHMLKTGEPYRDLGADYFERLHPERLQRYLVKRLEALGFDVALRPREDDAA